MVSRVHREHPPIAMLFWHSQHHTYWGIICEYLALPYEMLKKRCDWFLLNNKRNTWLAIGVEWGTRLMRLHVYQTSFQADWWQYMCTKPQLRQTGGSTCDCTRLQLRQTGDSTCVPNLSSGRLVTVHVTVPDFSLGRLVTVHVYQTSAQAHWLGVHVYQASAQIGFLRLSNLEETYVNNPGGHRPMFDHSGTGGSDRRFDIHIRSRNHTWLSLDTQIRSLWQRCLSQGRDPHTGRLINSQQSWSIWGWSQK